MTDQLGERIVAWMERSGERYLKSSMPRVHQQLLLQIGGARTVIMYDGTTAYWQRVQAVLDCFFTAPQRAEMCSRLIVDRNLRARADFRHFLANALAEIRVHELAVSVATVRAMRASLRSVG
jgi:hypothetical protein